MNTFTTQKILILMFFGIWVASPLDAQTHSTKFNDYIGWGVSVGSSSTQQSRIGLMYSTTYTHWFSENIAFDAGISINQRDYRTTLPTPYTDVQQSQVAIYGDATLLFTLAQFGASDLTIGLGPSLQYLDGFSSNYLHNFIRSLPVDPRNIFFIQVIDAYSFGGNFKIDYNIPIRESNCEIGIRAQGHFFAVPFTGLVERFPAQITTAPIQYGGWSARLGVFLRFGV